MWILRIEYKNGGVNMKKNKSHIILIFGNLIMIGIMVLIFRNRDMNYCLIPMKNEWYMRLIILVIGIAYFINFTISVCKKLLGK